MSELFNPYAEWLDVPNGRRPANHYELLGLTPDQCDPAAIAHAADVLISKIRRVRPGQHMAQWQQLLDEVKAAKACLADPASRSAYDAELRRPAAQYPPLPQSLPQQPVAPAWNHPQVLAGPQPLTPGYPEPPKGGIPMGAPVGSPLPVATPVAPSAIPMGIPAPEPQAAYVETVIRQGGGASRKEARRPAPGGSLVSIVSQLALLVIIVVGAGFAFMLYQERQREKEDNARVLAQAHARTQADDPADEPPPRRERERHRTPKPRPRPVPAEPPKPAPPEKSQEPAKPAAKPEETPKPGPKPQPSVDPHKQKAFREAIAGARLALSESELEEARRLLETAVASAQTPEENTRADRLKMLAGHVEEFWKTMRKIVAKLDATEEIPIRDDMIVVVEASESQLIIKVRGQMRRYSPLERMPHVLVTTLADQRFAKTPASKAVYASYLTVAPKGDRQRARQLFQEAIAGGLDVKYLLPELDQPAVTPGNSGGPKTTPPSDQSLLKQTLQAVRQRFKADYDRAAAPADKGQLAKRLLEAADAAGNDPNTRFVLFTEARDLAIAAGEPGLACEAIDALARSYTVDGLTLKAAAMEEVGKNARGLNSHKEIVESLLPLMEEAIRGFRLEEAGRMAEVATTAAQKSKSTGLLKQIRTVASEIDALRNGKKPGERAE